MHFFIHSFLNCFCFAFIFNISCKYGDDFV